MSSVVEKLDDFFLRKSGVLSFLNNVKGEFINYPFTFTLTKRRQHYFFDKGDAILKGDIQEINKNETSLEITVRPGFIYLFFFLTFFIIGVWALIKGIITQELFPVLSSAFLLFIVLPLISFLAIRTAKKLRNIFEKQMDLST